MDVNTLAHFWTLKAYLPGMIKAKTGHVVCIYHVCFLALRSINLLLGHRFFRFGFCWSGTSGGLCSF